MRVFRDVEMMESLGLGMPRVLQSYGKECFQFIPKSPLGIEQTVEN